MSGIREGPHAKLVGNAVEILYQGWLEINAACKRIAIAAVGTLSWDSNFIEARRKARAFYLTNGFVYSRLVVAPKAALWVDGDGEHGKCELFVCLGPLWLLGIEAVPRKGRGDKAEH